MEWTRNEMPRPSKEVFHFPPTEEGPFTYACDRCEQREARRWGVATVGGGDRGQRRQKQVGLCDPCAAMIAAPGQARSGLGGVHSIASNGRKG